MQMCRDRVELTAIQYIVRAVAQQISIAEIWFTGALSPHNFTVLTKNKNTIII